MERRKELNKIFFTASIKQRQGIRNLYNNNDDDDDDANKELAVTSRLAELTKV